LGVLLLIAITTTGYFVIRRRRESKRDGSQAVASSSISWELDPSATFAPPKSAFVTAASNIRVFEKTLASPDALRSASPAGSHASIMKVGYEEGDHLVAGTSAGASIMTAPPAYKAEASMLPAHLAVEDHGKAIVEPTPPPE
ncbi:hypothetical protein HK101_004918, partial [Irineochytrium annulatum]